MPTGDAVQRGPSSTRGLRFAVLPGGKDATGGGAIDRPTLSLRSRTPIVIAFAVAGLALLAWFLTWRSDVDTLRGLPAEQRAAVAERALANLRQVCQGPDRPREFCKDQAALVLRLPECDEVCREHARIELLADVAVK